MMSHEVLPTVSKQFQEAAFFSIMVDQCVDCTNNCFA